jgi:hypothetical protein
MGTTPATRPAESPTTGPDDPPGGTQHGHGPFRPFLRDILISLLFIVAAGAVGHGLFPDPTLRELAHNPEDQILIEWFLAVDVQVLFGDQGLVTDRLNAPDGINMLANATSLTLGLLLAPITVTLGAPVSFAVLTVGNLAATSIAWYLLFARTLGAHRLVAAAGGAFCGFAPAMISHSNSHWHMTAQWLVPAIVWSVLRLAQAADRADHRRVVTSGLWLAGLVVAQFFLGAEVLFLTALTLALFTVGYALARRQWARRVLPAFSAGLLVATGAASLVLAYPLWVQFGGPGSVTDGPFSPYYYSADLLSWVRFSPLSLAGSDASAHLATSAAEYNTFLGWPLLLVGLGCVIWLRREPVVSAAASAGLVMMLLSLGPELVVNGHRTGIPLLYRLLVGLPVVDGALPQRYAIPVVPLLALVLVWALERARRMTVPANRLVPVAVGLALLPLLPTPLVTQERQPVPEFISAGHWRQCVEPGGVLVPVPTPPEPQPMRWPTAAGAEFAIPEGFFIGPYGEGGRAAMGTYPRPTSMLLAEVASTGAVPEITDQHRQQAAADLAYWGAQCVVLDPQQQYHTQLRAVLVELLGPGEQIADVWAWPIRPA